MVDFSNYNFTCKQRFLKYVQFDTQSNEESNTIPSTAKQKDLAKYLVEELKSLGLKDAYMDKYGYVWATLPANVDYEVPVNGLIAHMDTAPTVSGANVKPQIHENYQGGDIVLKNGKKITVAENPVLKQMIGHDIITTDGTTLLGADDKAGIAEIMDALNFLIIHPEVKHGTIKIAFTPDEEIGRGTQKFDVEKFGAKYAYTIDGGQKGEIEYETFSADAVTIVFNGKNVHPGYAKGKMINAVKVASYFIDLLPKDKLSPETTEGREGYVHPIEIKGNPEAVTVKFIIRDFETPKLKEYEDMLRKLANQAVSKYPGASFEFTVKEQYRNMAEVIKKYPEVVEIAKQALKNVGIQPIEHPIRGGTDGARLSFMGLPTPNLFAGGHNFHSIYEFVSVQDMQDAVKTIVEICRLWAEKK